MLKRYLNCDSRAILSTAYII